MTCSLDIIQEGLITILKSNNNIQSNFKEIIATPNIENVKIPSLIINLFTIQETDYYGYFKLHYNFILITQTKSQFLQLFDILLKELNIQTFNYQNKISLYLKYTGAYDELFDISSNRLIISTIWLIKAISLI